MIEEKIKDAAFKMPFNMLFNLVDKDGSGEIDLPELKTFAQRMGFDLSDHRLQEIFSGVK